MEGKKCREIGKNCQAVSEVYGQLLMISIVVLSFSTIALTVFSDGGAVDPPHTPHIDLSEKVNTRTDTIQILHSGGEAIDLPAIKIMLSVKRPGESEPKHPEFSMSKFEDPDGTEPDDDVFTLGDCIVINTTKPDDPEEGFNITSSDTIDMFFVHTPSKQVIQRTVLQAGSREPLDWITPNPYGSVYSTSTINGGWLSTEQVHAVDDGLFTRIMVPKNEWVHEKFEFGIDADEMDISDPLTLVQLRIIYRSRDCSPDSFALSIHNGTDWTSLILDKNEYSNFHEKIYPITEYVNSTEKLENLSVKLSAKGNANNNEKYLDVDFIGVHIEF